MASSVIPPLAETLGFYLVTALYFVIHAISVEVINDSKHVLLVVGGRDNFEIP